ncbi:hydrolase [Mycobacterium paraense]|uniref:Hydrolase n=1 Tax=Mycobacterium paraense TaxID=767916 RepID=A0A1X2AS05_9MYCO|nr:zinc-dependent metalloprotease [Mycobacterium paraense]MCV7441356.1 zinc-dependent metalloprotease [Mycobacterium paraense]ORW31711.1 hydrolase [Mycobacterium paraense]ORW36363.1 hydrolase [Mycobacterium paraense]ORW42991.1 hydrolase [Mycobacterium paraense]ORW54150.1 hydrolase [Mycobacterium paraense]
MTPSSSTLTLGTAVDWRFAATVGQRLARPGPASSDYTRRQVIEELTSAAAKAEPPVREVTGLITDGAVPAARIVDRSQWIGAAAESMRVMTNGTEQPRGFLTGRITGAQTGAVLAFVSSGILGQYDPFASGQGATKVGSLLLVYPNVIAVERQLRVEPSDFRLWVCLHEVTHRVQFTANPWLSGYMSEALGLLTQDVGEDVGQVAARLADYVRNRGAAESDGGASGIIGLVRAVQSEPQRKALDQLLVLGTLLEGHADHVMDAVGPVVVPSVATIRRRFDERRHRKQPPLQRLLRALLGLDAKLSQYTRGKAFVDHVVGKVGMQRFNTVWSGPDTLPLPAEIEDPQRWIDRVL